MRTTVTLDDDVAALVQQERERTGETFRQALNRLVRGGGRPPTLAGVPPFPVLPGQPAVDLSDVSAVLAALDDERRAERSFP